MNRVLILCLVQFLIFSCGSDQQTENQTKLEVRIEGPVSTEVTLTRPLDGILLWDNRTIKLTPNEKGLYVAELSINEPEQVLLRDGKSYIQILLMPNEDYRLDISEGSITFTGDNAMGQELLNSLNRPPTNAFAFINIFDNDSTPKQLRSAINTLKTEDKSKLVNLKALDSVTPDFYTLLERDIDYYYAAGLISLSDFRSRRASDAMKNIYSEIIEETKKKFPYKIENTPRSWPEYVMDTEVRTNMYGGLTQDKVRELYESDGMHSLVIDRIDTNIEEPYAEKLKAFYLFNEAKQLKYEKSLISLFQAFKKSYPESDYTAYLTEEIQPIAEYHEKVSKALTEDMVFVKDSTISSLNQLISKFDGQKLYIDMWATWCGPCKKEFKSNADIETILIENDFKKLFISIDKPEAEEKWVEMIKYYDLKGFHHLANRDFFLDFEKNHSTMEGMVAIPQYLIVDASGTILTNNAPKPSQANELRKVIESY